MQCYYTASSAVRGNRSLRNVQTRRFTLSYENHAKNNFSEYTVMIYWWTQVKCVFLMSAVFELQASCWEQQRLKVRFWNGDQNNVFPHTFTYAFFRVSKSPLTSLQWKMKNGTLNFKLVLCGRLYKYAARWTRTADLQKYYPTSTGWPLGVTLLGSNLDSEVN